MSKGVPAARLRICQKIVCPHCWSESESPDLVWVATNEGDERDTKLATQAPRFRALSFNRAGNARGPYGGISTELACPACHLEVPRAIMVQPTFFFSIFGTRGSGKSFFLSTMTKRLEDVLFQEFKLSFLMVLSRFNQRLEDLQKTLFNSRRPLELTRLPKNQAVGDFYSTVNLEGRQVDYPIPFLYELSPNSEHPKYREEQQPSGVFVLYDNAGEDFENKIQSETRPVTQHLITASVVFVIIDPFKFRSFREACLKAGCKLPGESGEVKQVPMTRESGAPVMAHAVRDSETLDDGEQDQAKRLSDTMAQIRAQTNRGDREKENRPICVVVTKYDAWRAMMRPVPPKPWLPAEAGNPAVLRTGVIESISAELREILKRHAGELVGTLEKLADAENIYYFPVSATGRPTERMADGGFGVRPADIQPIWAEVPMLYALSRNWLGKYVPGGAD